MKHLTTTTPAQDLDDAEANGRALHAALLAEAREALAEILAPDDLDPAIGAAV